MHHKTSEEISKTRILNNGTYHFESNESIEASLVMLPADSEEDVAPFPSFGSFPRPSPPMCDGFHEES